MASDYKLGPARPFLDPASGTELMEQPVLLAGLTGRSATAKKADEAGFLSVEMAALWTARTHFKSTAALVIVLEAARQKRMNGGSISVTSAFCEKHGVTRREQRTAVVEIMEFGQSTGWVTVRRPTKHSAAVIDVTPEGLKRLLHPPR